MGIGSNNVYRLIAIDFDGTLLSPKGVLTPRTREALHAVVATGCKVCFATGRNFTESHAIIAAAGLSGIGVFVGGAMTMTVPSGNVIHRMAMRPELARQVSAALEQMGHPVLAMQDHSAEGIDYLVSHDIPLTKCSQDWMDCVSARVLRIKDLGAAPHDHTLRVGAVADTPAALVARDALQKLFGDRIVTQVIAVNAGLTVLEVFDPAVNKWAAISRLAAEQGIGPGQIIAVGDEVNDLPMVRNAGLGVAMGNAVPELMAVAARVIAPNSDDGLAQFIEELLRQNQLAGEPSSTAVAGNASPSPLSSGQLTPGSATLA